MSPGAPALIAEIECAVRVSNELGEAPLWDPIEQALYWVDIGDSSIHRFRPPSGVQNRFATTVPVTALGRRASGGLITATRDGFAFWDPVSERLRPIADPEADRPHTRFNDGAVDPQGRFWAGTTSRDGTASLYRLDAGGTVECMETGITIANGLGWSPDGATLYFTDTRRLTIYAYDFDSELGEICNRRPFVRTPEGDGVPDGLTVDADGGVWSVRCRAGKLVRYDPAGRMEREILLPVSCPTSCAFGGGELDELFVTSSRSLVPEANRAREPLAGDVLCLRPGVRGRPEPLFIG